MSETTDKEPESGTWMTWSEVVESNGIALFGFWAASCYWGANWWQGFVTAIIALVWAFVCTFALAVWRIKRK